MYSRYRLNTDLNVENSPDHRPASMYGSDLSEIQEEEPWKAESPKNLSQRTAMTLRCSKSDATPRQEPWRVESNKNLLQSLSAMTLQQRSSSDACTHRQEPWEVESVRNPTQSTSERILQRWTSDPSQKQESWKVESASPPQGSLSQSNTASEKEDKVQEIDRLCREDLNRLERSLQEKKSKVECREDRLKEMLTLLDQSVRQVEETRRNAEDRFRGYVEDFLKIRARVLMLQDQWSQQRSRLLSSNNSHLQLDDFDNNPDLVEHSQSHDDVTKFSDIISEPNSSKAGLKTSMTSFLLNQVRVPTPSSEAVAEYLTEIVRPMDRSSLYKLGVDDATTSKDLTEEDRIVY